MNVNMQAEPAQVHSESNRDAPTVNK